MNSAHLNSVIKSQILPLNFKELIQQVFTGHPLGSLVTKISHNPYYQESFYLEG